MSTSITKPERSAAQIAASRSNGARSFGPTTSEGKTKISTNRMTHGFRSNCMSLNSEDSAAYDQRLDQYLARYAPINKTEEDLVGLLASNMWQILRISSIEVALFNLAMGNMDAEIVGIFADMDEYGRLALAFQKSAGDNAFELVRRYKSTAERAYHRALQVLEKIQKERKSTLPVHPPDLEENLSTVRTQQPQSAVTSRPPTAAPTLQQAEIPLQTLPETLPEAISMSIESQSALDPSQST